MKQYLTEEFNQLLKNAGIITESEDLNGAGFWINPKGEIIKLGDETSHVAWMVDFKKIKDRSNDIFDLIAKATATGWIRIRHGLSFNTLEIELDNPSTRAKQAAITIIKRYPNNIKIEIVISETHLSTVKSPQEAIKIIASSNFSEITEASEPTNWIRSSEYSAKLASAMMKLDAAKEEIMSLPLTAIREQEFGDMFKKLDEYLKNSYKYVNKNL